MEWAVGDLGTGEGITDAVEDVRAIVHCATSQRTRAVDVGGTLRLLDAARRAGSPHLVYISIVGIDRIPFRYYQAKLQVEQLIGDSGLPWTTQFHDLILKALHLLAHPPVLLLPRGFEFQPVEVDEVAERLVTLVLGEPAGRVLDMGGPQVLTVQELARGYLRAARRQQPIVAVALPGAAARGFREGGHLCPGHADGKRTWAEFLTDRFREDR